MSLQGFAKQSNLDCFGGPRNDTTIFAQHSVGLSSETLLLMRAVLRAHPEITPPSNAHCITDYGRRSIAKFLTVPRVRLEIFLNRVDRIRRALDVIWGIYFRMSP